MRKSLAIVWAVFISAALVLAGCAGQGAASPQESSPTPGPTSSAEQPTLGPQVGTAVPGNSGSGFEATATPAGPVTSPVTLQDNGRTIYMKVGDTFLLQLGEGFDWQVEVADTSVLSRQVNVTVVKGAQGIYEALKPGSTTLMATGDPLCRQSKPPCGAPSIDFKLQVEVQ